MGIYGDLNAYLDHLAKQIGVQPGFKIEFIIGDPKPDPERYPHKCPKCSNPAYIGAITTIECSSSACVHYK